MTRRNLLLFVILINIYSSLCLKNGLAETPPMGWLAWERFKCNIRCDLNPATCISERLFLDMADRLVSEGYREAGYKYINIDDCWMASKRDLNGDLAADRIRFPSGIPFLADYMHSKGLKLGIYHSYGKKTCMGFPGIMNHIQQDLKKFAEWDIDMVKIDACYSDWTDLTQGYIAIGKYLKNFKKPILYSCSWPYYEFVSNIQPNFTLISAHCNMWRLYMDITDSWKVIEKIIDFFGDNQEVTALHTGPGHWNDPDMIMVGNHHLTAGQSRAQMSVWAMIPGPLLMSNDLRLINPESKAILLNKKLIAINQDPLGLAGKRIYKKNHLELWKRAILPALEEKLSYAVLFLNRHPSKMAVIKFSLMELDIKSKYLITDIFGEDEPFILQQNDTVLLNVLPMDVVMLKCEIVSSVSQPRRWFWGSNSPQKGSTPPEIPYFVFKN